MGNDRRLPVFVRACTHVLLMISRAFRACMMYTHTHAHTHTHTHVSFSHARHVHLVTHTHTRTHTHTYTHSHTHTLTRARAHTHRVEISRAADIDMTWAKLTEDSVNQELQRLSLQPMIMYQTGMCVCVYTHTHTYLFGT